MSMSGNFGQYGFASSYGSAAAHFNSGNHSGGDVASVMLRGVDIAEARTNQNWLIDRQKEAFGVQNSTTSPWQVGWEWASGEGPRDRTFTNGDTFTEMLRQHSHIDATRNIIRSRIMSTNSTSKGSNPYILGGIDGVGLYIKDYSTLLTAGKTGNLAVTYLGSYGLKYAVTSIDGDMAMVTFTVTNSSTISSATHPPPIIGYTNWWNKNIGDPMNRSFSSGPFSKTTQTFIWMENLKWK